MLAIGTELLLGQIVDTNSSWIGEHLAMAGIDTMEHRKVGDNLPRMIGALAEMLEKADSVIVCGGLGPTQDDVTREAIAAVMGVELERREELVEQISAMFGSRMRDMPLNNLRQAEIPVGAAAIPNPIGTAPGVRAPIGDKVIYAVPGVPYEMHRMVTEQVLPDLLGRAGEQASIVSLSLKTWGQSESGLAEMIAHRVDAQTNPTIAFLARGIEGLVVRRDREGVDRSRGACADRGRGDRAAVDSRTVGVRCRRRDHRARCVACPRRSGLDAGCGRIVDRGAHRLAHRSGAGRECHVPRFDRLVRDRREAFGVGRDRGDGGERGLRSPDGGGSTARAGCRCGYRGHGRGRAGRARGSASRHGVFRDRVAGAGTGIVRHAFAG